MELKQQLQHKNEELEKMMKNENELNDILREKNQFIQNQEKLINKKNHKFISLQNKLEKIEDQITPKYNHQLGIQKQINLQQEQQIQELENQIKILHENNINLNEQILKISLQQQHDNQVIQMNQNFRRSLKSENFEIIYDLDNRSIQTTIRDSNKLGKEIEIEKDLEIYIEKQFKEMFTQVMNKHQIDLNDLRGQITTLQENNQQYEERMQNLQIENQKLKITNMKLNELQQQNKVLVKKLNQQSNILTESDSKSKIKSLKDIQLSLNNDLKDSESLKEDLVRKIQQVKNEINAMLLTNPKVKKFQQKIKEYEHMQIDQWQEVQTYYKKLDNLYQQILQKKKVIEKVNEMEKKLLNEKAKIEEDILQQVQRESILKSQLDKLEDNEEQKNQIQQELISCQTELEMYMSQIKEYGDEIGNLREYISKNKLIQEKNQQKMNEVLHKREMLGLNYQQDRDILLGLVIKLQQDLSTFSQEQLNLKQIK